MKTQNKKVEIIERELKSSFAQNRHLPVRPEWEREVMRHILGLHAIPLRTNTLWDAPAIWRTATAISLTAAIMLIFTVINNIGPEYEAARLILDDPMGFTFAQLFFQ